MSPGPSPPGSPDAAAPAVPCGSASAAAAAPLHRLAAAIAAARGNRCGHVPGAPRFDLLNLPADANPARPVLIARAIAKLQAYYGSPREARWDPLSQGERHHRLERALEAAGGPATPEGQKLAARLARWRQQRSERREAVVAVLMLLLAYTDIETLTVAIPAGGGWLGLSVAWIAERTGLSASRVKRALATLNRAGLLTSSGAGRRFDARRRRWVGAGWGPVRRLSFDLIRRLGLEVAWNGARRRRRKDRVQRGRAAEPVAPPPPAARRPPRARPPSSAPAASPNWPPPASPPPPSAGASPRPPSRPSPGSPRHPPCPTTRRPPPEEPGRPAVAPPARRTRIAPRFEPDHPRFSPGAPRRARPSRSPSPPFDLAERRFGREVPRYGAPTP